VVKIAPAYRLSKGSLNGNEPKPLISTSLQLGIPVERKSISRFNGVETIEMVRFFQSQPSDTSLKRGVNGIAFDIVH
jgi:hypothetical protein